MPIDNRTLETIYFEVEAIIDHKTKSNGGMEYLLKWKDFGDEENSWIDEEDTNAPSLIRNYWINKKNIVKRRGRPRKNIANRNRRSRKSRKSLKKNNVNKKQVLDLTIIKEINGSNDDNNTVVSDSDVSTNDSNEITIDIPQWLQPASEESERTNQYFALYTHNNWENHATILNVVRETENDSGDVFVHIKWPDGTDSYHISSEVYQKCPLKLIQFYEQHLVIKN